MQLTHARRLGAVLVTAFALTAGLTAPAEAARPTPGDFTGFAFDTCHTPDRASMDAWRTASPFWGVGVYLGGAEATCDNSAVLTSSWVSRQTRLGWRVLPIWVGPQAECHDRTDPDQPRFDNLIDTSGAESSPTYPAARAQGVAEADAAVAAAQALGLRAGSTLWYDLEGFDTEPTDCRRSALSFLSSWTKRLHRLGWTSGVYSSVASGIHALDNADELSHGSYLMPDHVWFAWDNGRADTFAKTEWVRQESWMPHARVHQYELDTSAAYGGVTLPVDRNFMDVGRGSVAPRARATCGVRVSFPDYRTQARGDSGPQVRALQCLLKQRRKYAARITGTFDVTTVRAVRTFQRSRDLRAGGRMDTRTWTVLLAEGTAPVVKRGSVGDPVRRVQRGLTATLDRKVVATGVFDAATTVAVLRYQRQRGLPVTGVVASDTWRRLTS